jgi:hypothetical protein
MHAFQVRQATDAGLVDCSRDVPESGAATCEALWKPICGFLTVMEASWDRETTLVSCFTQKYHIRVEMMLLKGSAHPSVPGDTSQLCHLLK